MTTAVTPMKSKSPDPQGASTECGKIFTKIPCPANLEMFEWPNNRRSGKHANSFCALYSAKILSLKQDLYSHISFAAGEKFSSAKIGRSNRLPNFCTWSANCRICWSFTPSRCCLKGSELEGGEGGGE